MLEQGRSMRHVSFNLTFDGPAVDDGAMDVHSFAPSILAFADLLVATNKVLNEDRAKVNVTLQAIGPGSFDISLGLDLGLLDQARQLLGDLNTRIQDADTLLKYLFGIGAAGVAGVRVVNSLWELYDRISRRRIERGQEVRDDAQSYVPYTRVNVAGDVNVTIINVAEPVDRLYRTPAISDSIPKVFKPLEEDGIDSLKIGEQGEWERRITSEEAARALPLNYGNEDIVTSIEMEQVLSVYQLTLAGNYVWRFNDGDATFTAKMADEAFAERVAIEGGLTVRDQLRVRIRYVQKRGQDGNLKMERTVLEVIEHIRPPQQLSLNAEEPD